MNQNHIFGVMQPGDEAWHVRSGRVCSLNEVGDVGIGEIKGERNGDGVPGHGEPGRDVRARVKGQKFVEKQRGEDGDEDRQRR